MAKSLQQQWAERAAARQPRPVASKADAGRYSRRTYPPAQPLRGIPIVDSDSVMTVPWIWRCVRTTSAVAAGLKLQTEDLNADPFDPVMRWDPIGRTGYTAVHLLTDTYNALQVHGMAFWEPVDWDEFDRPSAVVPLWSRYAYPVRFNDGRVRIQLPNTRNAADGLSPDEVIWFSLGGDLGADDAYSPLRFLARQAAEAILQEEHSSRALITGGATQAGLVWTTDAPITPDQADEWADSIDTAGGGRSMRSLVVGEGLRPVPLGLSWQELQMIEARRYTSVEICAAWGMPPGLLGISIDGASTTYSNLNQDLSLWDRLTLTPMTTAVNETLGVWWEPVRSLSADLTRPTPLERARTHEIELRARYRDVDQVRSDEGLEPDPVLQKAFLDSLGAVGGAEPGPDMRVTMEEVLETVAANGQ